MKYQLGCIGSGNMGSAIIKGAVASGVIAREDIWLYDVNQTAAEALSEQCGGVHVCVSPEELAQRCNLLVLAVKPNVAKVALAAVPLDNHAVLSIVAGLDYERLAAYTSHGRSVRLLRVMPNTPLLVGQGAVALAMPSTFTEEELNFAEALFAQLGLVERVNEGLMSAVTGVSGSGPAYVYMFIEAMADAGVKHGLPRAMAVELAAQTVLGSAKMVLETKRHPGALKDDVCSPGGTTIAAVAALEEQGLRNAIIKAVDACVEKTNQL